MIREMTRYFALAFVSALLVGCGVKGPLTLPQYPEDSYLNRMEKTLNEMTGEEEATTTPPEAETKFVVTPEAESQEVVEPGKSTPVEQPDSTKAQE